MSSQFLSMELQNPMMINHMPKVVRTIWTNHQVCLSQNNCYDRDSLQTDESRWKNEALKILNPLYGVEVSSSSENKLPSTSKHKGNLKAIGVMMAEGKESQQYIMIGKVSGLQ